MPKKRVEGVSRIDMDQIKSSLTVVVVFLDLGLLRSTAHWNIPIHIQRPFSPAVSHTTPSLALTSVSCQRCRKSGFPWRTGRIYLLRIILRGSTSRKFSFGARTVLIPSQPGRDVANCAVSIPLTCLDSVRWSPANYRSTLQSLLCLYGQNGTFLCKRQRHSISMF